ncbi:MAG: hypothetical protein WC236_13735, partial [Gallionellaceae bacterium]
MACRYTYQGKTYEAHEFDDVLRAMQPSEASKYMSGVQSVPSAPMIGDTKSWTALALKRMIAYAAENGFDRVAWTTGEQQAARYDLSKQIDHIIYGSDNSLQAFDKNGDKVMAKTVPEKDLEETIGKEAAQKLIDQKPNSDGEKFLNNADLKVGGEGMKGYYDQIVPQVANDILKKIGGKVESVAMPGTKSKDELAASVYGKGETYKNLPSKLKRKIDAMSHEREFVQQGFTITPAMREKVLGEGLPLFSAGKSGSTSEYSVSSDQSAAKKLNDVLVSHFNDESWRNAYVQRDLRDSLAEFAAGARAAFDTEVVGVTGETDAANQLNGVNVSGKMYVNLNGDVSFINTAGHEIFHELERERPDLHQWFKEQARQYYQNFDAYQNKLNALVQDGEQKYSRDTAENELLADFAGDALADTEFLAQLAEASPSKFKQLLNAVTSFLKTVLAKLKKSNGSEKYISDVEALRKHLNTVMLAYAHRDGIEKIRQTEKPVFSSERGGQSPESFARLALEELAAENDSLFAHKNSVSKTLTGVIADVVEESEYLGDLTREDENAESGADRRYAFKTKNDKLFYVYENDNGEVWIDVSRLDQGSGGAAIYAAVGNYAYNTGKRFIGDPNGLSPEAVVRRTHHMLSSALRFGTTRHLDAAKQQAWGAPEDGVTPLEWKGSEIDKTEAMVHTIVETSEAMAPSLKEYHYDFQKSQFSDAQGQPVTGAAMAANTPRDAGIGEKTARRVVLLRSLLDADRAGGSGGRSGILEKLLSYDNSSLPESMRRLFSRRADGDVDSGNRSGGQKPLDLQGGEAGNAASWDSPESSKMDDIIYTLQDKHIDMKRVVAAIKDAGGKLIEKFNPYLAEELFHGRAAKRTHDFVNTELKPLLTDMQMRGLTVEELDQYLHARHAKEANALIAERDPEMQDGGSGMTDAEADEYMASLDDSKRKRLEAAAAKVDAIITKTRDLYVSYGLIS